MYVSTIRYIAGIGGLKRGVVFIGEAPSAKEEELGRPFVGKAGLVLDWYLKYLNLSRADVYVTNVVKVRPPDNRAPTTDEIRTWIPSLQAEIKSLLKYGEPIILVALGSTAAKALLTYVGEFPLSTLRGSVHRGKFQLPVIVTYHPAYVLRNSKVFEEVKKDLDLVTKNMLS